MDGDVSKGDSGSKGYMIQGDFEQLFILVLFGVS